MAVSSTVKKYLGIDIYTIYHYSLMGFFCSSIFLQYVWLKCFNGHQHSSQYLHLCYSMKCWINILGWHKGIAIVFYFYAVSRAQNNAAIDTHPNFILQFLLFLTVDFQSLADQLFGTAIHKFPLSVWLHPYALHLVSQVGHQLFTPLRRKRSFQPDCKSHAYLPKMFNQSL